MVAVGQLVAGRYRIEAPLARGGMGAVYRAVDQRLSRTVAVKVLHGELASDTTEVARFEREAAVVARLHHPGLVQVLDAGDEAGVPYLVMELVQGRTLGKILGTEGKLAPIRAADVVEQALFAISVAHGAGVVHRDLKPGNIMVVSTGGRELVKVLDFGIAQLKTGTAYTRLTQTGVVVGTPMFMAPEQLRGETCDARTDVYAMGVVLWCCLTGRKPFSVDGMADAVLKVMNETPARADRVEPSVPAALATTAEVAMNKQREGRFATANAFATALAELRAAPRLSASAPAPRASLPAPELSPPRASAVPMPAPALAATPPAPRASLAPTPPPPAPVPTARSSFDPTSPPMPPTAASTPGASFASAPPIPETAPGAAVSPRALLAALGVLSSIVVVLGCVVAALAYRALTPAAASPMGGAGSSPYPSLPASDPCERAASCCELLLSGYSDTSSCGQIRGLARYGGQMTSSCQQMLDMYRQQAQIRGLRCD